MLLYMPTWECVNRRNNMCQPQPLQVAASVMSYPDIMHHSTLAWEEVSLDVFRAAWVVCGYVEMDHFAGSESPTVFDSVGAAKHILEPCGVLDGSTLMATPQYCPTMDWRIQDIF